MPKSVPPGLAGATDTVASAVEWLSKAGIRLSPIGRTVLQLLCREQRGVGAYDLLSAYEKAMGRRAAANTIYRALHFLEEHGLVAHLSSTRTYVVRAFRESAEPLVFFVCIGCKTITECKAPHIERAVSAKAKTIGFSTRSRAIEVQGVCEECVSHRKAAIGKDSERVTTQRERQQSRAIGSATSRTRYLPRQ